MQGVVQNATESPDNVHVTLEADYPTVGLVFDSKHWKSHLETVKPGDRIEAEGKISSIDRYWIFIYECEVIEITASETNRS